MDGSNLTTAHTTNDKKPSKAGSAEQTESPESLVPSGNPQDKPVLPTSRPIVFFSLAIIGGYRRPLVKIVHLQLAGPARRKGHLVDRRWILRN